MVKLAPDLLSIVPFEDGTLYKEVTPEKYVEGPFMLKRNGKYYFMWSEGGWTGPDYCVAYAIADSPFGGYQKYAGSDPSKEKQKYYREIPILEQVPVIIQL